MKKITTPNKALMQRLFLALFAMLTAGLAWAGPEDDALAAYSRKDYAAVLKIVEPPAIKGEAWAQSWLADAYRNGQGVAQSYAEAVKWYRLSAQQGDASAQFNLGFMYTAGQGVLQDYTKAHALYNLAATKGNADAVKSRDIVAKSMSPQQIADAQKLARDCLARNFKGCD